MPKEKELNTGIAALLNAYRATTPEKARWILGMAQMCAERYPRPQLCVSEVDMFMEWELQRLTESGVRAPGSTTPPGLT